jgi:AcrR family transcriptional regulator
MTTIDGFPLEVCTHYYVVPMATTNGAPAARRARRSPQEVRDLLLGAARTTFATRGYARTSTREIADAAGVSEALLFRHFGTKAHLFELAILRPFHGFLDSYVDGRPVDITDPPPPPEVPSREYVDALYDVLSENRELVIALLAARAYEVDLAAKPELSNALDRLQALVEFEMAQRGLVDIDVTVTIRVTFALVVSQAVFGAWLFPKGKRPPREQIVDEMVRLMVHGLAHAGGTP